MTITFAQFQATRREVSDLRGILSDDSVSPRGYMYDGDAYIEILDDGRYMLTLYRAQWTSDTTPLEKMEALLYAWSLTECADDMGVPGDVSEFICALQDGEDFERFADALLANRAESNPDICHLHDYCDANEIALAVADYDIEYADDIYNRARPFLRG